MCFIGPFRHLSKLGEPQSKTVAAWGGISLSDCQRAQDLRYVVIAMIIIIVMIICRHTVR